MPTHLNLRYQEIEDLWPSIEEFQRLAEQYGVHDVFQDAGGKMVQLAIATGLDLIPERTGPDGEDRIGNLYEVKTVDLTASERCRGFTTNHHLTVDTINRYRDRRFIFATYDRITLLEARLVEAEELEPIFQRWEELLVGKNHLNNPKIPLQYVRDRGKTMYLKDVPPPWTAPDADI